MITNMLRNNPIVEEYWIPKILKSKTNKKSNKKEICRNAK